MFRFRASITDKQRLRGLSWSQDQIQGWGMGYGNGGWPILACHGSSVSSTSSKRKVHWECISLCEEYREHCNNTITITMIIVNTTSPHDLFLPMRRHYRRRGVRQNQRINYRVHGILKDQNRIKNYCIREVLFKYISKRLLVLFVKKDCGCVYESAFSIHFWADSST